MEKAVIYARVSSEEQAKHGFSIENQKRQCLEFAERNNYYVRRILEIISEKITYKDKVFNIELKPIFRTIVENQYVFVY